MNPMSETITTNFDYEDMTMSEKKEKKIRTIRRLQYLRDLENWLAVMPSPWRVFAVIKWRARKPKFQRRD